MAIWEWIPDRSVEKEVEIRHDGMTSGGAYGAVHLLDKKAPIIGANLEGRGLTVFESNALFTSAMSPGATWSGTDNLGNSWTGTIKSVAESFIDGTPVKIVKLSLINAVRT